MNNKITVSKTIACNGKKITRVAEMEIPKNETISETDIKNLWDIVSTQTPITNDNAEE